MAVSEKAFELWIDITGDSIVDTRDIVRAKKVTAGLCDKYAKGDINEDGKVDETDKKLLSDYLKGKIDSIPTYNADINGDGVLDMGDIY